MSTIFKMEYNAIKSVLSVEQDGKPVSGYSQFAHCIGASFWKWYKDIAGYCFSEANGIFDVRFVGGWIQGEILRKELHKGNGCSHFSVEPEFISGRSRMLCTDQLMRYAQVQVKDFKVDISFDSRKREYLDQIKKLVGNSGTLQYLGLNSLPIYLCYKGKFDYSAKVFIVSNRTEFYQVANSVTASFPRLVIEVKPGKMQFVEVNNNCYLFTCSIDDLHKLLMAWTEDVLFPEYGSYVLDSLRHCHNWKSLDAQTAMKMIDTVESGKPYLSLSVSSKIEMSSTGMFKLTKFPADFPCHVYTKNGQVVLLGNGGLIKPVGEGTTEIVAEVKDDPAIRVSQNVTVYKYRTVQKIHLQANKTSIMEGEQITVACDVQPRNANNLSQAQWSMTPSGILQMVSGRNGVFQAVKAGRCEITYTVGAVKQSVTIMVYAKATSVKFAEKTKGVKLGDMSQNLWANVYPQGAKGATVRYKVSDSRVLDIDSNNGQIIPKQEGNCVVTAVLLDSNTNVIIDDCQCDVTILPPKDVVNPDGALVLLIISLIGAILLVTTPARFVFGVLGLIGAIWYSVKERTKGAYITSGVLFTIILILVCIGGML